MNPARETKSRTAWAIVRPLFRKGSRHIYLDTIRATRRDAWDAFGYGDADDIQDAKKNGWNAIKVRIVPCAE